MDRRIRIKGGDQGDSICEISNTFWPIFFSLKLTQKFIGQTTCYCLTNARTRTQIVFVYPELNYSDLPKVDEITSAFPVRESGVILSAASVPINELRIITGVHVDDLKLQDRRLIVIQAAWYDLEKARFCDNKVYGFDLPACECGKLILSSDNHVIMHQKKIDGMVKIIALIRIGKIIELNSNVQIKAKADETGDLIVHYAERARESDGNILQ
ncbi:MAG: hypothetical protein V1928_01680 [Parcubacteria group bacterium]